MEFLSRFLAFAITAAATTSAPAQQSFVAPHPEDLIFYHVFLDRFADGNPANNNANPRGRYNPSGAFDWHGGDLQGVRDRLDYIAGLNVNALWLSPFLENVSDYHGYGTYNWYGVDPNFGDMETLKALIRDANERGIAVYYDIVAGHCGNIIGSSDFRFPGYLAPPQEYQLRWTTSLRYPPPFNLLDYFHAHGHIGSFYAPEQELGELLGLDDLRTDTPYVRERMKEIWEYWIRETGVSGFRVDTVKHVDLGFWEDFFPHVEAVAQDIGRENFFTFGEIYGADADYMREYTGQLDGAPYKLDGALDFQFYYAAQNVFARATRPPSDVLANLQWRAQRLQQHDPWMPNFLDNHDVPRFLNVAQENPGSGLAERQRRLQLGLVMLFTAPGPPIVYYGTEQAFDGGHDPYNRENMFDGAFEFGPSLGDNFDDTSSLYQWVAQLSAIRRDQEPLRRGTLITLFADNQRPGGAAFLRQTATESLLVTLNNSTAPYEIPPIEASNFAGEEIVNLLDPIQRIQVSEQGMLSGLVLPGLGGGIWTTADQAPPPQAAVAQFIPANGEAAVAVDLPAVTIRFTLPMDTEETEQAVTTDPALPFFPSWNADQTELTLNLEQELAPRTEYTVSVDATAQTAEGQALPRPFTVRWRTGRGPLVLPPLPRPLVLVSSAGVVTVDGIDAEWPRPEQPLEENTGTHLADASVYFWQDALGDDNGPGTYVYPSNSNFSGQDADINHVRLAYSDAGIAFVLQPRSINPAASFFTPYFGIAISTAPGGREAPLGFNQSTGAAGVAELQLRGEIAPELEIVYTGPAGISAIDASGVERLGAQGDHNQQTGVVEIFVPWSLLTPEATPPVALDVVIYSALETFGGVREVQPTSSQWEPGGGNVSTTDPDVFDLAGADRGAQRADLSSYDDDFPSILGSSVLRFTLVDAFPDQWLLH